MPALVALHAYVLAVSAAAALRCLQPAVATLHASPSLLGSGTRQSGP